MRIIVGLVLIISGLLQAEYRIPFEHGTEYVHTAHGHTIKQMVQAQLNHPEDLLVLTGEQQPDERPRLGMRRAQEVANICLSYGADRNRIQFVESPNNNLRVVRGCLLCTEL